MADLHMEDTEDATNQVWQTFRDLAPMLDKTLKLTPNAPPKRQRKGEPSQKAQESNQDALSKVNLAQALTLLTKLTLQLDKDLQVLKKEDTFIFFFANKGKESSLHNLMQATETWVQKHQENQKAENPIRTMPLRQHLLQVLFNELLTKIEQLGNAQAGSDLLLAAQNNLILLKDNTCPYVQWDHTKKALVVSNRKPLSLKKLHQLCTDLLEAMVDINMVTKFHALPTGDKQNVSPWKLQVSLRQDTPWMMLQELCSSAIWLLLGTSLKAHSLTQSPLAYNLQKTLLPTRGPPKGKGKGKNKINQQTKTEDP